MFAVHVKEPVATPRLELEIMPKYSHNYTYLHVYTKDIVCHTSQCTKPNRTYRQSPLTTKPHVP